MRCRGVEVVVKCSIVQPLEDHTSQINGHHCKWVARKREREYYDGSWI